MPLSAPQLRDYSGPDVNLDIFGSLMAGEDRRRKIKSEQLKDVFQELLNAQMPEKLKALELENVGKGYSNTTAEQATHTGAVPARESDLIMEFLNPKPPQPAQAQQPLDEEIFQIPKQPAPPALPNGLNPDLNPPAPQAVPPIQTGVQLPAMSLDHEIMGGGEPLQKVQPRPETPKPVNIADLSGMDYQQLLHLKSDPRTSFLKKYVDPLLAEKISQAKTDLDNAMVDKWNAKIANISPLGKGGAVLFNEFKKENPMFSQLPPNQQAEYADAFKAPVQQNLAGVMGGPAGAGAADFWAQGLATRQYSMEDFAAAAGKIRGANGEKFIRDTFAKWGQIDPGFNPTDARIGMAQATDKINNRTLSLIQSVRPNLLRLQELSDKIGRSGVKFISHAELAASRALSDEDLAKFDALKTLSVDEINQIFSPGGGSDKSRDMAISLINETLPREKLKEVLPVVIEAMDNRAKGIQGAFRGYKGPTVDLGDGRPTAKLSGAGTVWRRAKDGKDYEYDAATKQPTGKSR